MRSRAAQTRWGLTEESLGCLIRALDRDERLALERFQRLHGRLRLFFMRQAFTAPEDHADEVVDRLALKLAQGLKIDNIEAYALGLARMVGREARARHAREQRRHAELARNNVTEDDTSYEKEIALLALDEQLDALGQDTRALLMEYHEGRGEGRIGARRKLAERMGISIGALRKRVCDVQARLAHRLRATLGEHKGAAGAREKNYFQP